MAPFLSKMENIAAWKKSCEYGKKSFKDVTLKVVGKSSVVQPKDAKLMRFYLSNGEKVFRFALWETVLFNQGTEELSENYYKLKIGSVVKLEGAQVKQFYKGEEEHPSDLNQDIEFSMAQYTKIKVMEEGQFQTFPADNTFPPYWRNLKDMKKGDIELAMQVVILNQPQQVEVKEGKVGPKSHYMKALIGDREYGKVTLAIHFQNDSTDDKDMVAEIKHGVELVIWGATVSDDNGKVGIEVARTDYVVIMQADKKTLTAEGIEKYKSIPLKEPIMEPPQKKTRKSVL